MASTKKLQVEIVGDSRDLERAFGKAGRAAGDFDKRASRSKKALGLLGKAAGGAALAVGAGFAATVAIGVKGLISDEKALAKVESTIKSTGGAANVSSKDVTKLAGELQSMSGVGADTIMTNQSLLLSFTGIKNGAKDTDKVFDEATKTMLDMSVALDQDMKSSAVQLGKALNDPVKGITALSRVGVSFTEQQKSQIAAMVESGNTMGAQKVILAELNKEFGGTAEALGETTSGKIERVKRNFEEMAKKLTEAVLPAVSALSDWLINVGIPWLEGFSLSVQTTLQEWRPYFEATFEAVRYAAEVAWAWMQVNLVPIIRDLVATIQAILAGLQAFWNRWGEHIVRITQAYFSVIKPVVIGILTQLKAAITLILAVLRGDWGAAWEALKELALNPLRTFRDTAKAMLTNLVPALGRLAGGIGSEIGSRLLSSLQQSPIVRLGSWLTSTLTAPFKGPDSIQGKVGGFATEVGKSLGSAMKAGVNLTVLGPPNLVIRALNALVGKIDSIIPFVEFGRISPISKFAEGGVVRGPTLAMIGEDGDEVVVPVGAKRKKQGQKLLSVAAAMLGAPGDMPGGGSAGGAVARARELGIPMFANGAIATRANPAMLEALIKHQAKKANERNIWERVGDFFAQGLASVIGQIPAYSGAGGPLFSPAGRATRDAAENYVRNLFAQKDVFKVGKIEEAKKWALAQMGKPYVWGGGHGGWNYNLPGYDCSGFSSHAAKKAGSSIGGPGTTMTLHPGSNPIRSGGAPMYWGFRGMSGGPREQHMGTKILGTWYQFGNPGKTSGSHDSQWDSLRAIPGLGSFYSGTPYVPSTGPITAHRGEAVLNPSEAREYRARGGAGGPLIGKLAETVYFTNPTDARIVTSDLAHKVTQRLAVA